MKRLNKRVTIITNIILTVVCVLTCAIMFLPEPIIESSGGNLSAIYNGNRENKKVAMMFNVYQNTQIVEGILDVLGEEKVKATFFVGGCWADDNGETLKRIVSDGHEIANHGYFHKDHKNLSEKDNELEISRAGIMIESLCGVKPDLFAPPSGSFSKKTLAVADRLGYRVIMWSKDTIDWRDKDEDLIFKRATNGVNNGDLILMHPTAHTLNVLPRIVKEYKALGLVPDTVSAVIR